MGKYKTYKQYDSRWGSKNYNGSSTMSGAGCGPTAVACLAHAINPKITPWTVAKYMKSKGYAIYGNGTAWAGIPAAMQNYGLKDVKNVASMTEIFKLMENGYCAVFLMRAGTRGGITWTTAGHFIAVTNYKVKDGKHWFYTRDPGGRNHDGWFCYETQMQGLIPQVWMGYVEGKLKPTPKPTTKEFKGIDVSAHQSAIDWEKVKKAGYTFVIIRAGYGKNNKDKMFESHIKGAIKAGLDIGIYWFSYAYTKTMARNEGAYCSAIIKPYKSHINMPVYFDFEYDSMRYAREKGKSPTKTDVTDFTEEFIKRVEKDGYTGGFYYNYDYKQNHYVMDRLEKYSHWYALYSDERPDCDIQQYSSQGRVNGVSGNVDVNRVINYKKRTQAERIAHRAERLAYAYGVSSNAYSFEKGKPKVRYANALEKIFPYHNKWKPEIRTGASCSVFVATVARITGADEGLICDNPPKMMDYMNKSSKWKKVNKDNKPVALKDLQPGDIIAYEKTGSNGNGHILIYKGDGYICEANFGRCYPHTAKIPKAYLNENYIKSTYKRFGVYRRG